MTVHTMIVGMSRSGKSTFVREVLLPRVWAAGVAALILDPVGQPWGRRMPWVWQTRSYEAFMAKARAATKCVLLMDECTQHIGKSQRIASECAWVPCVSANSGHRAWFIGQRVVHIPTDFRSQCGLGYIFRQQDEDDARAVVQQFGLKTAWIERIQTMPPYECLRIEPYKEPVHLRVTLRRRQP